MAKDDDKSGDKPKPKPKPKPKKKPANAKKDETGGKVKALKPTGGGVVGTFGVADALRKSFANYIHENEVRPKGGDNELNVDIDFVKDHAAPLLASMLRDLTKSLLPKDLSFSVPLEAAEGEEKDGSKDKEDGGGVNVNFDFGAFLGRLFQPPRGGQDKEE